MQAVRCRLTIPRTLAPNSGTRSGRLMTSLTMRRTARHKSRLRRCPGSGEGGIMILRRWCIAVAMVLIAAPVLAGEKTVGVVMSGNIGYYQEVHRAFANGLIKEGFDRRKVDTLLQMPAPDPLSWTNAVRKLIVADVNVLVTYGGAASLIAIKETKSVPIVYAGVYDPLAMGVNAKNATGISSKVPLTSLLKYAKKLTPFTKLAVVYNELEQDSVKQVEELGALEGQYGFQT